MKIPAKFRPKSWEMPPGARVLEDSASVVVRNFSGRTQKWVVALIEIPEFARSILWTRPLDLNFDAGFVAFKHSFRQLMPMLGNIDSSALGATLTSLWQSNQLARYFFCNETGALRSEGEPAQDSLLVAPNGVAAWTGKEIQNISRAIVFDWGAQMTNSEFLQMPSLELWERIQNNPSGKSLCVRQFAIMNDEKRHQLIWGDSCISEEKMETLLRTLIAAQSFWAEEPGIMEVSVDVYTEKGEIEVCVWQGINWEMLDVTEELIESAKLLSSYFRLPLISNSEIESNSYHKIWMSRRPVNFELAFLRPTAHEQLEAHLRWREWLASIEER